MASCKKSVPSWLAEAVKEGRVTGLDDSVGQPATKPAVIPANANHSGGRALPRGSGPNKTESRYAREALEPMKRAGVITDYWFEPLKFKLADRTYYTPDWMLLFASKELQFVEVKGRKSDGKPYCEDDAMVKIKVAAKLYPFVFRMVWPAVGRGWMEREYRG